MPRNFKLTWQPGTCNRVGRWKKKYKGKAYYFPGGRGKSDRDAYLVAMAEWEKKKLEIDALAPKPHQVNYELAIGEWESVLGWCRKHDSDQMADIATAKIGLLRNGLATPNPKPVDKANTFDGQFDRSVRYPGLEEMWAETTNVVLKQMESSKPFSHPGNDDLDFPVNSVYQDIVIPKQLAWDHLDALKIEQEIWRDRLEVMQRSGAPLKQTLKAHVDRFVEDKVATVSAGELSAGRIKTLRSHLNHFMNWMGHNIPVTEINGKTLIGYRIELLKKIESNKWSQTTAKQYMSTVKSFIRWLWQIEAIVSLPRNMDSKSQSLKIGTSSREIIVFTKDEIATLLTQASDRTQLYVLLMLNCGMTQKDIADLQYSEVDWEAGRITRKRSKTKQIESVPEVSYVLWPETLRLLRQERSSADSGRVLLNEKGNPLWKEEVCKEGNYKKNDTVKNAFGRLRHKTKISKPMKSLKKTSASLIRNNEKYAGLESVFLGHAPQSIAHKHYAQDPQGLLDEAVTWLRDEYGIMCG